MRKVRSLLNLDLSLLRLLRSCWGQALHQAEYCGDAVDAPQVESLEW